jgi:hypothetical protein
MEVAWSEPGNRERLRQRLFVATMWDEDGIVGSVSRLLTGGQGPPGSPNGGDRLSLRGSPDGSWCRTSYRAVTPRYISTYDLLRDH